MTKQVELRSIVFKGINQVELETKLKTFMLGPRDVLIQTLYSCISAGTEVAKLSGLQEVSYPLYVGTRAVGHVVATGNEADHIAVGDLVFSHIQHQSHSLGQQLVCPLPNELEKPTAAMLGMALVAMTGVQMSRPELGDTVVVTGGGLVGQFAAQLSALSGAYPILIDIIDERLQAARLCGINITINPTKEDANARIMELTNGKGADTILECTGVPAVATSAISYARRSGRFVFVGSPRGECQTNITPFLEKVHLWKPGGDLTLLGSHEWKIPIKENDFTKHSMEQNCRLLSRLMIENKLKADPLFSRIYDPGNAAEAYQNLINHQNEVLGAIFDWRSYQDKSLKSSTCKSNTPCQTGDQWTPTTS